MEHLKLITQWIDSQPLWVKVQIVASITLLVVFIRVLLENFFISNNNGAVIFLTHYSSIIIAAVIWFGYNQLIKKH